MLPFGQCCKSAWMPDTPLRGSYRQLARKPCTVPCTPHCSSAALITNTFLIHGRKSSSRRFPERSYMVEHRPRELGQQYRYCVSRPESTGETKSIVLRAAPKTGKKLHQAGTSTLPEMQPAKIVQKSIVWRLRESEQTVHRPYLETMAAGSPCAGST
jgi:hypothetical protein